MNRNVRPQRQLTFDEAFKGERPSWRPDGRKIAYQAGLDIRLMDPDGTGQQNIISTTEALEVAPAWSPDGRRIAFKDADARALDTVNPDGSDVRPAVANLQVGLSALELATARASQDVIRTLSRCCIASPDRWPVAIKTGEGAAPAISW